jgi:hypothetical protein
VLELDPQLAERWETAFAAAQRALDAVDRARLPLFDTTQFRLGLRAERCWFNSECALEAPRGQPARLRKTRMRSEGSPQRTSASAPMKSVVRGVKLHVPRPEGARDAQDI